jgi:putative ABC transport system substrate-binding protein
MIRAVLLLVVLTQFASSAQAQGAPKRIGYFSAASAAANAPRMAAFRRGMTDLGWIDGKDYIIDARYAEASTASVLRLAADVVASRPDVILTPSDDAIKALADATKTIPIVFATASDPIQLGVAKSLQRPGGNATGLASLRAPLAAKGAQLLKESFPGLTHLAFVYSDDRSSISQAKEIEGVVQRMGMRMSMIPVKRAEDIEAAVARAKADGCDSYVVADTYLFISQRKKIIDAIAASRLPAVYSRTEYAEAGGLMSYATPTLENFRHAAVYVDKILKGAKPGDLPIEQPNRFELTVNMKTAEAMAIKVPTSLLVRADKVLQ